MKINILLSIGYSSICVEKRFEAYRLTDKYFTGIFVEDCQYS